MKVLVNKCKTCGALFEDMVKYKKHIEKHNLISVIHGAFPPIKDDTCDFANGHWNVQRSEDWLKRYEKAIEEAVVNDCKPWSYGWFRCLDDSGDMLYPLAVRVINICLECFIEWGQPYHAIHCNHKSIAKD